ncbi:MAG: 1-deoxy-D-xylulose-5-phosphate synthase [Oscillospiraceae bacterium]
MYLENITSSKDLENLNIVELEKLADEIRKFLIDTISKTGGHLAPNLGVVELTIAIHSVFNPEVDKIVWDVGHQSYTHKILTGRAKNFDKLRQLNGMSGFPKTSESFTDAFNTGHSSTSISAALGFAKAAELSGSTAKSVAVIGDGALTGGMAFEALNQAGSSKTPLIVILNDNGMSISKNVGGLSKKLKKMRNTNSYFKLKDDVKSVLDNIPLLGKPLKNTIRKIKKNIKRIIIQNVIFEDLGFTYLGPVDGHNIIELKTILTQAKKSKEPVIIHVNTKKGKGYEPAEKNPGLFHGISAFDPITGEMDNSNSQISWSDLFGKTICELAEHNDKIVAITAAMPLGTGLLNFASKYPTRFFDVGIAEQHAVTFAAAFAKSDFTPVFAVYSTFLQRGYDQILHDVALQQLHVVFCIDRSGAVGEDGETHQGVYDISYLSHIPGIIILSPSNDVDFIAMLKYAINDCSGPVAIRYPRGKTISASWDVIPINSYSGQVVKVGTDVVIVAVGVMLSQALEAAEILENINISVTVIDAKFVKPIDIELIKKYSDVSKLVVTVENNVLIGGFGEQLESKLGREVIKFAYPDEPIIQGKVSELIKIYGLNGERIARVIENAILMYNKNLKG